MTEYWFKYRCPVCHLPLQRSDNRYLCASGHNFDLARKGYIHLLPSHRMASRQPGDNKMMIEARRQFLSAGYYSPIVDALVAVCAELNIATLLDAGCGEGYYTVSLAERGLQVAGVDISKEGILASCRRSKAVPWCVASVADLPYMDRSFDAVLSVFCRVEAGEFARVARRGGFVIYVGPGRRIWPGCAAGYTSRCAITSRISPSSSLPVLSRYCSARSAFPCRSTRSGRWKTC